VRSMNCYYSNLIEGHDTHPIDIDQRALKNDYSADPSKARNLQLESQGAHIAVQQWELMMESFAIVQPRQRASVRPFTGAFCALLPGRYAVGRRARYT